MFYRRRPDITLCRFSNRHGFPTPPASATQSASGEQSLPLRLKHEIEGLPPMGWRRMLQTVFPCRLTVSDRLAQRWLKKQVPVFRDFFVAENSGKYREPSATSSPMALGCQRVRGRAGTMGSRNVESGCLQGLSGQRSWIAAELDDRAAGG